MLTLGSTYLIAKDFDESLKFYEALLQMKPSAKNLNRWAQFNFNGSCIALFNPKYDEELISNGKNLEKHYNGEYLKELEKRKIKYGNSVVLNFWIENLSEEYQRIKELNIGNVTELMYLNIASPYNFFWLEDPDGNLIEITGGL